MCYLTSTFLPKQRKPTDPEFCTHSAVMSAVFDAAFNFLRGQINHLFSLYIDLAYIQEYIQCVCVLPAHDLCVCVCV